MKLKIVLSARPDLLASGQVTAKIVDQRGLTIGRGPENDWVIHDPDRVLSKTHCVIRKGADGFTITDTSTNGVFLNGSANPIGRDRTVSLRPGARLQMGDYGFSVETYEDSVLAPGYDLPGDDDDLLPPLRSSRGEGPFGLSRPSWNNDPFADSPVPPGPLPGVRIPDDADEDLFAPTATQTPWGVQAAQPDHLPAEHQAFIPSAPAAAVIPDDWDLDHPPPPVPEPEKEPEPAPAPVAMVPPILPPDVPPTLFAEPAPPAPSLPAEPATTIFPASPFAGDEDEDEDGTAPVEPHACPAAAPVIPDDPFAEEEFAPLPAEAPLTPPPFPPPPEPAFPEPAVPEPPVPEPVTAPPFPIPAPSIPAPPVTVETRPENRPAQDTALLRVLVDALLTVERARAAFAADFGLLPPLPEDNPLVGVTDGETLLRRLLSDEDAAAALIAAAGRAQADHLAATGDALRTVADELVDPAQGMDARARFAAAFAAAFGAPPPVLTIPPQNIIIGDDF